MNSVDNVEIYVKAGDGGNGTVSFRHEKYVPFGGPDGGDGGAGGNVYIKADKSVSNLAMFRRKKVFKAGNGADGAAKKKFGKRGNDLEIIVPPGTLVQNVENGERSLLADLIEDGQRIVVAKGGRGGLGNVHFATSTNQSPEKATTGKTGEEVKIILDLKILADIGIIGYPNVGKSTLLAAITAARPKIAEYPFTTLEPVLGELKIGNKSYVVAEIPGLIEDAHKGKGLGHEFLRHAERTRILIHVVDGTSANILEDMERINRELELYKAALVRKPQLIAVNKVDLPEVRNRLEEMKRLFDSIGLSVLFISGITGEGIPGLLDTLAKLLKETPESEFEGIPLKVFRPAPVKKRG